MMTKHRWLLLSEAINNEWLEEEINAILIRLLINENKAFLEHRIRKRMKCRKKLKKLEMRKLTVTIPSQILFVFIILKIILYILKESSLPQKFNKKRIIEEDDDDADNE